VVVFAERANAYKPAPEPYRLAMRELAIPADAILYVAGSRYDAEGAFRQGMTVFWVRRQDEAPLIGPRYVRTTLRDLPHVLGAGHRSSA
jgi:FMN phosphatase YigB (HAD superfamily)